jgi:hypothetical protein
MTLNPNPYQLPLLPPNTIVPQDDSLFISYFNRLYEDIAFAVNNKDASYFEIPITNTAVNIPNIANFGAFIVCVSGATTGLPCITAALSKASSAAIGDVFPLNFQAGTVAPWVAATLTISSTATNFQIAHSVAATTGNFNIRIIGTQ